MKKTENECVGCTSMGLPCRGNSCPNKAVTRFYCDECGGEEELYYYDEQELCIECVKKKLTKVED